MRQTSTWRKLTAAAAVLPIVALAPASPAGAQDEPFGDPSAAAAAWLTAQAEGPSWEDIGVGGTMDAVIGLMAAGVGGDQVQDTLEWLNEPDVLSSYIYQPDPETDESVLAPGAAGKVMYVVATAGGDPTDFGGVRLAEEVADAPLEGVAPDSVAWAALGLARTDDGVTDEITETLLAAQCDDGGFTYDALEGGDCTGSPDTTGVATSALAAIGGDASDAYEAALTWLEDNQGEAGDFDANANSTAMASQAMLASDGRPEAAETSLTYLIGLQVGCGDESAGAIRFSEDDDGSDPLSLQFATTQALVPLSGQSLAELDASAIEAEIPAVECGAEDDQTTEAAADDEADDEGTSWLPWVIAAAVVLLVAAIAFAVVRGRRGSSTESAAGAGSASSSDEAKDEE
ncbi:hypothetical protein [Glycomyces salinus]|uniref:hypothetical protein n=1 Tax=Glycomyces salinus TaxID=980294 RepID=UPI0018EA57F5|nr:hypothetical protein [Glycomyces salinus]